MQEIGSEFPGELAPSVTTVKVLFPSESEATSSVGIPSENEVPPFIAVKPGGAPATHVIVAGGGALLRTETDSDRPAWIDEVPGTSTGGPTMRMVRIAVIAPACATSSAVPCLVGSGTSDTRSLIAPLLSRPSTDGPVTEPWDVLSVTGIPAAS